MPDYCRIKGNINKASGDRVYHTPESPWYGRTEIDTDAGERWFCTEREAIDAGWRAPERQEPASTSTAAGSGAGSSCGRIVNINAAGTEELEELPGIGEVLAGRIVDYRNMHGDFDRVEELQDVRGIGEKTVENLRPCVVLE